MNNRIQATGQAGLSLIELMIAMVLGLVVLAGGIGVFLSNQQTQRLSENLARMQDSARYAFEIMSRDLRGAGGTPCGKRNINVTNTLSSDWWTLWSESFRGVEGEEETVFPSDRINAENAVIVLSAILEDGLFELASHDTDEQSFTLAADLHPFSKGDVVMVCNYDRAAIVRLDNVDDKVLTYIDDGDALPLFSSGAIISFYTAQAWYLQDNPFGISSLYVRDGVSGISREVIEGVTQLRLQYLRCLADCGSFRPVLDDEYRDASAIASSEWPNVVAVRITLRLRTIDPVGLDRQAIERDWFFLVSLRNPSL